MNCEGNNMLTKGMVLPEGDGRFSSDCKQRKMNCLRTEELSFVIMNSQEPLIMRNKIQWDIVNWTAQKWSQVFQDETFNFRVGKNIKSNEPQWEAKTNSIQGKFTDIFKYSSEESNEWLYYDYIHLKDNLKNCKELRKNIYWDSLGLSEVNVEHSSIWIGSKGACTPCHIDTYSCNIIVQVYGRKQWLLFPPETNLDATRVPYEESSIYSKCNFHCPDVDKLKGIKNGRKCILHPGDVLVLPHRWWHYVENLEPAISINSWLPLVIDDEERFLESIVQMLIFQLVNGLNEEKRIVLNPNMLQDFESSTPAMLFSIIEKCKQIYKTNWSDITQYKRMMLENHSKVKTLVECDGDIDFIPVLTPEEFMEFLKSQRNKFTASEKLESIKYGNIERIIETITQQDVISVIKEKYLNGEVFPA